MTAAPTPLPPPRRGLILPVVLVLIGLLALTMAGFIFFIRAETAGTLAHSDAQQARLAAESGLEEVIALLRVEKHNEAAWYDLPARFRHALVWAEGFDRQSDPVRQAGSRTQLFEDGQLTGAAWRYSLVAPSDSGLENTLRFGVTPESSKLNVNAATDEQIEQLLIPLLLGLQLENAQELVNALLDWRDPEDEPRAGGAENEFYTALEPAYQAKNAPLDTLEELLLVKGFSAAVLYGEDTNRNGLLDPNEDDGDETFPLYDNADGVLNRGVAAYLTTWSREPDTALDNKPRINLNGDAAQINAQILAYFQQGELSEATIAFINQLKGNNFDFKELGSPAALYRQGLAADGDGSGGAGGDPQLAASPVTLAELPYLCDRFSVIDPKQAQAGLPGRINVNTAPFPVLMTIPGMTPEAAAAIIDGRVQVEAAQRRTIAWPLVAGVVDTATFHAIAPALTTKSYQIHVEVLGYADHVKVARRYEWVIEMIGPLAQVKYRRDLTALGLAWPIDDETVIVSGR